MLNVLFEGGVAGCVVWDVIGCAKALVGVEGDLRGFARGPAASRVLSAAVVVELGPALLQCAIGVLLSRKQQFGQMLTAQDVEDESCEDQREDDSGDI